ncbi:shikimate dehydrogenase [Paenibacillus pini]|uniref:Shikimate dehydrogenase (NADP(+)) n=1 Tax=Paenibacillus pini JCM 16418 TaxID=1236976 RepID=W7YHB7_9BACL|nr:shikimate dehydrogenase [Paenibacillus pini]GAF06973.1 shikimate 5-dehydrogenase I alpha [Paenibacillus pini JCM 16418]
MNESNLEMLKNTGAILLGVIGDPIIHSKSPVMHQAALQHMGIQGSYVPLHVIPQALGDTIQAIRTLGFRGLNVTLPHKVEVMKYLDHLDETASRIGAVNTIVNDDGVLTGYNTDGIGYVRSLKDEAVADLKGKTILVIGAGGASRGIVYALAKEKPERIYIANRTVAKAAQIAEEWQDLADIQGIGMEDINDYIQGVDVLINTTSIGMHPRIDEMSIETACIPAGIVVSDLIYNPLKTRLLLESELKGCTIHGGLGMFINQGAIALEYWTGAQAPVDVMRRAVLKSMAL